MDTRVDHASLMANFEVETGITTYPLGERLHPQGMHVGLHVDPKDGKERVVLTLGESTVFMSEHTARGLGSALILFSDLWQERARKTPDISRS